MHRVRNLPDSPSNPWVVDTRPSDATVYGDNPVTFMHKLGTTTSTKLAAISITHIHHLENLPRERVNLFKSHRIRSLSHILATAAVSIDGPCPHITIDHRTNPNPYLGRYGEPHWRREIETSRAISPFVLVKVR